jgi:hypothetical protein
MLHSNPGWQALRWEFVMAPFDLSRRYDKSLARRL